MSYKEHFKKYGPLIVLFTGVAVALFLMEAHDNKMLSLKQLESQAQAGDGEALWRLGRYFMSTHSLRRDELEAFHLMVKSANSGNSMGEYLLARMYWEGTSTETNTVEAFRYFQRSAQKHLPQAEEWMGLRYIYGWGIQPDDKQAEFWLKKAAKTGLADSQYALGEFYTHNHPGASWNNFSEAEKWMKKAADQGVRPAQKWVASYLANPKTRKPEQIEAYKWAKIVGNKKLLQSLASQMTPAEIKSAESRAEVFQPTIDYDPKEPPKSNSVYWLLGFILFAEWVGLAACFIIRKHTLRLAVQKK